MFSKKWTRGKHYCCFRKESVHENSSRPYPKILLLCFEVECNDARRKRQLIRGCEKGNAQRIKMNISQSLFVSLIIKCIVTPHFVTVWQQGNLERVILAACGNSAS
jgi:hypothetical protein